MAKQVVRHGAEIDVATPGEVAAIVAALRPQDLRHREKGVIQLDATGAGTAAIPISKQYDWRMERVTIGGTGAPNALVTVNESDSGSDADMMEVIQLGTAGRYSDAFSNSLWIPAANRLWIAVTGGVANLQVTYNFQVLLQPVR